MTGKPSDPMAIDGPRPALFVGDAPAANVVDDALLQTVLLQTEMRRPLPSGW